MADITETVPAADAEVEALRAERDAYERAIQRMEKAFRPNKQRFWVLRCLRQAIAEERAASAAHAVRDALVDTFAPQG